MGALSGGKQAGKNLLRGVKRLYSGAEHPDIKFNGKPPAQWTPEEFEQFGKMHGVENLGPLSPLENVAGVDIPGGTGGKFTYYDLMHLKSSAIDPNQIGDEASKAIQKKFSRTLQPDPKSDEQLFNRMQFGMLSPNQPLTRNEFEAARLMVRSPEDIAAVADRTPWNYGDKVSIAQRKKIQDRDKVLLGTQSSDTGGLGFKGTADYTNINDLAKTFKSGDADWWRKKSDESWEDLLNRSQSQQRGMSSKVGSFSQVWQNPGEASISAIDRHMGKKFEPHLFGSAAEKLKYEDKVKNLYNARLDKAKKAKQQYESGAIGPDEYQKKLDTLVSPEGAPVTSYDQVKEMPGGNALIADARMGLITGSKTRKLRNTSGELNEIPEFKDVEWLSEPEKGILIGDKYRKALEVNQELASEAGMGLFENQWNVWDKLRGRLEPHEIMFPGLEKLPPMSKNQLASAYAEHGKAGYNSGQGVVDKTGVGKMSPPAAAYWTPPALAVGAGALAGAGASQDAEAGFFGPASKLWNKSAEAAAKKMLRAGASRDSIWRKTGIDLGNVDGIPRAEFDDSSFDILTENLGWGDRVPRGSMSESISGTPILEHYPDIGDIRAAQVGPGESVFYRPGGAGPFDREKIDYGGRKSAAHELQHAIQGREGMTSGASGQNMNYRRNAGEVEARNVEDRIGMSPQERIDTPPWLTEDTPTREQLVPGGRSRRKLAIADGVAPAAGLGGMLLGEQAQAAAYSENPYAILAPSAQQVINSAQPNVIAEGAVNPRAQQAAMLLRGIETPLDPMLGQGWLTGGISNWLDRAAYGKANWRDRAGAAMDFL